MMYIYTCINGLLLTHIDASVLEFGGPNVQGSEQGQGVENGSFGK